MKLKKLTSRIFFPEKCSICGEFIPLRQDYCNCQGEYEIKLGNDTCHDCGMEKNQCYCSTKNAVKLGGFTAVYSYEGIIKTQLHCFKFRKEKELYRKFGDVMSERAAIAFADADFDIITFVPVEKHAKRIRGYNQSELLAKQVAKRLFLPSENLLVKTEKTPNQHKLTSAERLKNLNGKIKFKEESDVKGKTILLCDDIKTTGATLYECKKTLIEAGAKQVYCITASLTPYISNF